MASSRKPAYNLKWLFHHLGKAMDRYSRTRLGQTHRKQALAKVILKVYEQAEKHGIPFADVDEHVAESLHRGGGGREMGRAQEVGLVQPVTTNYKVVSSHSQVSVHDIADKVSEIAEGFEERVAADVAAGVETSVVLGEHGTMETTYCGEPIVAPPECPASCVGIADPEKLRAIYEANSLESLPEGPQWPQKASVRVLGPCPNPKLWKGELGRTFEDGVDKLGGAVSVETNPKRRFLPGIMVEAELIRGGGSPVYRACP